MSRIGFVLASSVLFAAAAVGACSHLADDCENTSTCPPEGGSNSAGSAAGGKGGSSGSGSSGKSNAGDGGAGTAGSAMGGSTTGGKGGSSATAGEAGASGGGGAMLPCDGACASPKPVCDEPADTCVECLEEGDCAAGAKKKCDTTAKTCVECLAPADCTDATTAKCDSGACVKCTSNDDCAHVAGKGVCDDGTCVQCTTADESGCGDKSCNPTTKTCTSTPKASVDSCKPCVADSECVGSNKPDPDARCVPMEFKGTPRPGGFCLKRVTKTCPRPFQIPISTISVSGAANEAYCGIDQDSTRCEAVLDLLASAACADGLDSSCGCTRDADGLCTESGTGGLCRTVGVSANRCTYPCGVADDCPTGKTCLPDSYCH